jgi:ribosome-associated toxin RatA of RatAB toxin-antitoxin module
VNVVESRVVRGLPEHLFPISQDYARRLTWDTALAAVRLIESDAPALGATVFYRSKDGYRMLARYIAFEPPYAAAIKMVRGPWWLQKFSGSWTFLQITNELTAVTFSYGFRIRPRVLEWLCYRPIRVMMARRVRRALERFANLAEAASIDET